MKERPILFSAPMVRALLAGTKTQTRRIAKPVRHPDLGNIYTPGALVMEHEPRHVIERCCPYGRPGDRLWVRESHWWFKDEHDPVIGYAPPPLTIDDVEYRADGDDGRKAWRSPIHMPRWASRILLEVTDVRVQRLQDISEADAIAEGLTQTATGSWLPGPCDHPEWAYHQLWDQINGAGSWDANPWVWAVSFRVIKGGQP